MYLGIINKMAKDKLQEIVGAIVGLIFLFYISQALLNDLSFGPLLSPGLFVLMLAVLSLKECMLSE